MLHHIGAVHSFEPDFNITYGVRGCARTYKNFRSFRKHLLRQHEADMERTSNTSSAADGNDSSAENDGTASEDLGDDEPAERDALTDKKRSAALFLLKTKEICRVTQSALNHIVEGMTELFQVHTDNCTARPPRRIRDGTLTGQVLQGRAQPTGVIKNFVPQNNVYGRLRVNEILYCSARNTDRSQYTLPS